MSNPSVKIYKVLLPTYIAWPLKTLILKVCSDKEEAELFIANFPNLFLRPWLKVEWDVIPLRNISTQ